MLHVLSHWAHVVVLVLIVVHVRLEEWIFQELALHLLVEHVVFHIWSHAVGKHELVVLLAAISRVCYDFAAVEAELVTEGSLPSPWLRPCEASCPQHLPCPSSQGYGPCAVEGLPW